MKSTVRGGDGCGGRGVWSDVGRDEPHNLCQSVTLPSFIISVEEALHAVLL